MACSTNVWRRVLGVDRATVIDEVGFDEEFDTVVSMCAETGHQASLWSLRRGWPTDPG